MLNSNQRLLGAKQGDAVPAFPAPVVQSSVGPPNAGGKPSPPSFSLEALLTFGQSEAVSILAHENLQEKAPTPGRGIDTPP